MKHLQVRSGFSLTEFILFVGILGILGSTIIGVLMATQDARIRQRSISNLEQNGANMLHMLTRTTRRGELILSPAMQQSGSILAVQMASALEFPTIFTTNASGELIFIQGTSVYSILPEDLQVKNLFFRNTSTAAGKSVQMNFDLQTTIPLPQPEIYNRHFSTAVTLYPDDQSEAGGCGSCPAPTCINHNFSWSYCENEECVAAPILLEC